MPPVAGWRRCRHVPRSPAASLPLWQLLLFVLPVAVAGAKVGTNLRGGKLGSGGVARSRQALAVAAPNRSEVPHSELSAHAHHTEEQGLHHGEGDPAHGEREPETLGLPLGSLGAAQDKRVLGGYGQYTMKALAKWWGMGNPFGTGPLIMKVMFISVLVVQFCGPCALYTICLTFLLQRHARQPWSKAALDSLRAPLMLILVLSCTELSIGMLTAGTKKPFPLLEDIKSVLFFVIVCLVSSVPISLLSKVDRWLEQIVMQRVTSSEFLERRDFMNSIRYGANVVGPTDGTDDQGYHLFRCIWRPFLVTTDIIIIVFAGVTGTGHGLQGYPLFLGLGYIIMTFSLAVCGGRTLGPQLYGSIIILMEKPFKEGDIITVDDKRNGGAQTSITDSVVTGFVERIGICTTTVRRFDMRCVWVPNNYFAENPVANWNTRPRKLIYLQFSVSHRAPVESCKTFQEKVLYLIENHKEVDQNQYIKAAFRQLLSGLNFLIVCFNAPGTKKKKVQQDIIMRVLQLARRLDVAITFAQQNLFVEREEVPAGELYLPPPAGGGGAAAAAAAAAPADLADVLPAKKDRKKEGGRWFAPPGQLVIRIERVVLDNAYGSVHDIEEGGDSSPVESPHNGGHVEGLDTDSGGAVTFEPWVCQTGSHQPSKYSREGEKRLSRRPCQLWISMEAGREAEGGFEPVMRQTRTAHLSGGHGSAPPELRYFENLSFPLDSLSPEEKLPHRLKFRLVQVGKGLKSWALKTEMVLGATTCDVLNLVRRMDAGVLELMSGDKGIGWVYAHAFVPEGVADQFGWEGRKSVAPRSTNKFELNLESLGGLEALMAPVAPTEI